MTENAGTAGAPRRDRGCDAPLRLLPGFVVAEVAAEFPGLRLDWVTLVARRGASPVALVTQLERLAGRVRGATVITMRTKPIPQAYRAFFRQIGLDPDVDRIPGERVALQRLLHGGFRSVDVIADACLLALIETGVPVWALDADVIDGRGLGIRSTTSADARRSAAPAAPGGPAGSALAGATGTLAVADGSAVHGVLFADPVPASAVGPRTERVTLFAVAVDGVPAIHVEEALWLSTELIGGGIR